MHKNPLKNTGNGIKETQNFQNFPGQHAPGPPPLEVLAPSGKFMIAPPPQISKPVRL